MVLSSDFFGGSVLKYRAINDIILLKECPQDSIEALKSGLLISSKNDKQYILREVISLGDLVKDVEFSVGDKVICNEFSGQTFFDEGIKYVAVRKTEILAKVEE